MHPMNFGPSWLRNNPTMTSYDQSEMLSMCHDLQKPADPPKYRMLLNTEPSLPLALHAETVDQEAAVHPEVITNPSLWRTKNETFADPSDTNWRSPRKDFDTIREWRSGSRKGPSLWRQNLSSVPQWSTENSFMGGSFNTSGEFQAGEKLKDNVQGAAGDSHYPYQIPAPARSPEKQQTSSIKQGAAIPKSAHPLFDFVERVHFKEEKKAVEPPKSCTIPAQAEIFPDQIMPNPLDNWYYRDPQGNMQGPFSAQNLVDWKDAGYFKDSLNLCRQGDSKIWTIAELSKYGGFAPPVQPASTHQANQYYMLQQQRQQQQQFMPNPSGFNQMQSNMNYFQNPLGNVPFYHPSIVAPQPISQFQAQPELYQFHQGMHPQGQQNQQHVGGNFFVNPLSQNSFQAPPAQAPASRQPSQMPLLPLLQQQLTPDVCQALIEHLKTMQASTITPTILKEPGEDLPEKCAPNSMAASVNQPQSQSHQIQSKNEARPISKHQEDSSIQQKASSVDAIMPKTKAKPTHQEVKPEVHKLVQSKAPKTPQAREHEVPKEFEQHVMVKDIQPPKPFWPVCSSIPLQEIQREEVIKQKEIELKKPREPQQPKPQGLISWQNKGKAYSGKSLDEIQAEEDAMRKANQKETEIRRKANELALKVNQTQPLSFADMLAADKKKKTDSKKESATLQSKQAVQKNSPTPKTKPAKVAQNGQNGSNKAKIAPKSDALMDWCIETLGSRTDVDIPAFVMFLVTVDSPIDVQEYIKIYLGQNKQALDFTRGFLDRRSEGIRQLHSQKSSKDDLSSANGSWIKAKR